MRSNTQVAIPGQTSPASVGHIFPMPRPPKSELTETGQYTPELVEFALTTLATTGNGSETERQIKAKFGAGPSAPTIQKWAKDTYNTRYVAIREGVAEQIKSRVATQVEDLLQRSLLVQEKALDRAERDIEKLDAKDSAGALRNIATSAGILATNLREMRPKEPIQVEHTLNADELLRKLGGLLGGSDVATIEGSAEPILPAELPEG